MNAQYPVTNGERMTNTRLSIARACSKSGDFDTLSPTLSKHFVEFRPFSTKCADKVLDKVAKVLLLGQALAKQSVSRVVIASLVIASLRHWSLRHWSLVIG